MSQAPRLPDLLAPGLKVVFCGTAAGTVSATKRQYYAGPGNRFWWILAETGLTPRQLAPSEVALLVDFGIGLTDVVKHEHGADFEIDFGDQGRALEGRVAPYAPDWLCFNGKRAAQEAVGRKKVTYGVQPETFGPTRLFVAPSTSGAARGSWDASVWMELAELVRGAC